jgi:hypothetical protein
MNKKIIFKIVNINITSILLFEIVNLMSYVYQK